MTEERDDDMEDEDRFPEGWDEDGFIPYGFPGSIEEYEFQYLGTYY